MRLLITLLLNATALIITAYIVPGIKVESFTTAILASIILSVVNTFIKPVLSLISLPLTFLTFGLFAFVINAMMLMLVDYLVPTLSIEGFIPAVLGSIVLSVTSTILNSLLKNFKG